MNAAMRSCCPQHDSYQLGEWFFGLGYTMKP